MVSHGYIASATLHLQPRSCHKRTLCFHKFDNFVVRVPCFKSGISMYVVCAYIMFVSSYLLPVPGSAQDPVSWALLCVIQQYLCNHFRQVSALFLVFFKSLSSIFFSLSPFFPLRCNTQCIRVQCLLRWNLRHWTCCRVTNCQSNVHMRATTHTAVLTFSHWKEYIWDTLVL